MDRHGFQFVARIYTADRIGGAVIVRVIFQLPDRTSGVYIIYAYGL